MSLKDHYTGRAGHLAAMAELLLRRWNVAIPEVDTGDDIFVVRDADRTLKCVQVKTSLGSVRDFQFRVSLRQIQNVRLDPLIFVFVLRVGSEWRFLVMHRKELEDLHTQQGFGTLVAEDNTVLFRVKFDHARGAASGSARKTGPHRMPAIALTPFVSAWDAEFPPISVPS